ncbi:MAG: 30S ribosomal protein S16 [Candidatus Paceibacterota bacterium]
MLKIRLQRTGRKHEPTFRVVLTDSKNGPKSGKFLEILGSYDARRNADTQLKKERIQHWIAQGAQVSDTVHNLLITHEVIAGKKINVLPLKTPIRKEVPVEEVKEEAPAVAEAPAEEVVAEEVVSEESAPVVEESPVVEEAPAEIETPAEEVVEEAKAE